MQNWLVTHGGLFPSVGVTLLIVGLAFILWWAFRPLQKVHRPADAPAMRDSLMSPAEYSKRVTEWNGKFKPLFSADSAANSAPNLRKRDKRGRFAKSVPQPPAPPANVKYRKGG